MATYCDGDSNVFAEIYRRTAPQLRRRIRARIKDRATVEDLLQETFLRVHRARSTYIRGADPMPWLHTIASRVTMDELRRGRKHRLAATRTELDGRPQGAEASAPADPHLARAAFDALSDLPSLQREAVLLIQVHGRSIKEAAAIAGASPGAMKLRAHRGYVALRKLLAAAQGD
jgi:RNA polymerase sigma-70 factor (ECF subfamily)